jgi:hypothetical protein
VTWWQIALTAYLILTPFSEIFTLCIIMLAAEEWKHRKKRRRTREGS